MKDERKDIFPKSWKLLIVLNLLLSAASMWLSYSQNIFLSQFMNSKFFTISSANILPNTVPAIGNSLTASAFLITSISGIGLVISLVILIIVSAFLRKK